MEKKDASWRKKGKDVHRRDKRMSSTLKTHLLAAVECGNGICAIDVGRPVCNMIERNPHSALRRGCSGAAVCLESPSRKVEGRPNRLRSGVLRSQNLELVARERGGEFFLLLLDRLHGQVLPDFIRFAKPMVLHRVLRTPQDFFLFFLDLLFHRVRKRVLKYFNTSNAYLFFRPISVIRLELLHLLENVRSSDEPPEDGVLVVQMLAGLEGNKELRPVAILVPV